MGGGFFRKAVIVIPISACVGCLCAGFFIGTIVGNAMAYKIDVKKEIKSGYASCLRNAAVTGSLTDAQDCNNVHEMLKAIE